MRFIEQVVDGIICAAAIILAITFIAFTVKLLTIVYGESYVKYPKETAAPRIEVIYEKENNSYSSDSSDDDPIYWSYRTTGKESHSADG